MGCDSSFVYVFTEFLNFCDFTFPALPQTFLSKEPPETPTTSSLVVVMSAEGLRLYNQVPAKISLEISDYPATLTVAEADNAIYFTRELFTTWLHFPFPSLVKQFPNFTRAPPALVHPNAFRILTCCSVLNSLYQLDFSLVEICFIYTLKLGTGGRLSMSVHSPRPQFVTGLPNAPKIEAKGVFLVRGMWNVLLGSPRVPFIMNQSLSFSGLFQF